MLQCVTAFQLRIYKHNKQIGVRIFCQARIFPYKHITIQLFSLKSVKIWIRYRKKQRGADVMEHGVLLVNGVWRPPVLLIYLDATEWMLVVVAI